MLNKSGVAIWAKKVCCLQRQFAMLYFLNLSSKIIFDHHLRLTCIYDEKKILKDIFQSRTPCHSEFTLKWRLQVYLLPINIIPPPWPPNMLSGSLKGLNPQFEAAFFYETPATPLNVIISTCYNICINNIYICSNSAVYLIFVLHWCQ